MGTVVGAQRGRGLGRPHAIQGCRQEGRTRSHPELPLLVKVGIEPGLGVLLGDTSKSGLTKGPACPGHRAEPLCPVLPLGRPPRWQPCSPALPTRTGCGTSVYGPGAAMVHRLIHLERYRQADSRNRPLFPSPRPLGVSKCGTKVEDGCVCVCVRHLCAGVTAAHLVKGHREGVSTPGQPPAPGLGPRPSISVGTVSERPLQIEKSAVPAAKTIASP